MRNKTLRANLLKEANQLFKKMNLMSNYMKSKQFALLPDVEQDIIARQLKHLDMQHQLMLERLELLEEKEVTPTKSKVVNRPTNPEPEIDEDEAKVMEMVESLIVPLMEELPQIIRILKKFSNSFQKINTHE